MPYRRKKQLIIKLFLCYNPGAAFNYIRKYATNFKKKIPFSTKI